MAARERRTELRYQPNKHLFYSDGEIEATHYPDTRSTTIRRCDGSQYVAFNFDTLSEMVDYIRELRMA